MNVWVGDAFKGNCSVDDQFTFVATVQHCDGTILQWKGGKYQTSDGAWHQIVGDPHGAKPGVPGYYDGVPGTGDPGHIVFDLPPGCYIVSASVHVWIAAGPAPGQVVLLGNLATHNALVDVKCDQDVCVKLFQPSGWHCGIILNLELLLPMMENLKVITPQERANAEKALRPLLERLTPSTFDKNNLAVAKTIVKRLTARKER